MRKIEQKQYIELISTALRGIEKIWPEKTGRDKSSLEKNSIEKNINKNGIKKSSIQEYSAGKSGTEENLVDKSSTEESLADKSGTEENGGGRILEERAAAQQVDAEAAAVILAECLRAFAAIEDAACRSVSDSRQQVYRRIVSSIRNAVEDFAAGLDACTENIGTQVQKVKEQIEYLKQEILDESEIEYVILFLPYKASMWDSMESIWLSAADDPNCTACVAPIPYFDKNADGSFGDMHYDGNLMPDYVEIVDCSMLDLELLRPDVIYIHNPYDQHNHVTSIHPAFYSARLKQYTQMLVYVPYSISGVYESVEGAAAFSQTLGMYYADVIIAQSKVHKMLLAGNGNREEKIAVLGNPKFDYVFRHLKECRIPDEWKRLRQKKVFLVCISIGSFLAWDKIIDLYDLFIEMLLDQYHAAVIYRPHPLLEMTIKSMRPQKYGRYREFLEKYCGRPDFVFDGLSDYMPAVCASDCMIGDYSSLCFSYAVTGKPVAMVMYGEKPQDELFFAFDYREIYFVNAGVFLALDQFPKEFERFAEDMVNNHDGQKEKRMELIKNSIENLDGTCGRKVHNFVLKRIQNT